MNGKRTMLVIDDQNGIRVFMQRTFTEMGFNVLLAENGRKGIALFTEASPDIVLLDIKFPGGLDGIETLQELMILNPRAKVIMMTSYEDHYEECMALGAVDYLEKPFDLEDLKERVERYSAAGVE